MKRRLLYFIPLLVFVVITMTTVVAPRFAYAAPGDTADSSDEPGLSCGGVDLNIFDLSWIICPVLSGMKTAIAGVDDFINKQMSIGSDGENSDPNQIFCDSKSQGHAKDTCKAYYAAWSSVRNIALGMMVIAGLVVLIAQALGFEILDAYTIRKVLPRLLIAAVGLTLSWQLMQFFVTFSNDLAYGVRFLIYQPFADLPDATLRGSSQFLGGAGGLTALTFLGWAGLASLLITAMLAVFIAALVLVLRQLLIILLIIFAPIAIIAYILPNTKKIYDFWWDSFSKALLMFALIAGLIAIGRVFSTVASLNSDSQIGQLVGVVAYFIPYFLIPATFKFAGGAIRNIGGFVNDRSKGSFDRLRNFRGNQAKKNAGKLVTGQRLAGNTGLKPYDKFADKFNRSTAGTANFVKSAGYNPAHFRSRMQSGAALRDWQLTQDGVNPEKNPHAALMTDDLYQSMLKSQGGGDTDDAVRGYLSDRKGFKGRDLEEGVATVRAFRRSMGGNMRATKLAATLGDSRTGTGFQEADGGPAAATEAIIEASEGSRWLMDQGLIGVRQGFKSENRQDGTGGSYTKHEEIMLRQAGLHPSLPPMTRDQANKQLYLNAIEGQSGGALLSSRRQSQQALFPVMGELMDDALASGDTRRIMQEIAATEARHDVAGQVSTESGRLFADTVLSKTVDIGSLPPEVRQVGENYLRRLPPEQTTITYGELRDAVQHNGEYREMHKEWGDRLEAEARAAMGGGPGGEPGGPRPIPGTS